MVIDGETAHVKINATPQNIHIDVDIDEALRGQEIRVYDAEKKYGIDHTVLGRWARSGYIRIIDEAPKLLVLDEYDVARAVAIFNAAKEITTPRRAGWIFKRSMLQTA